MGDLLSPPGAPALPERFVSIIEAAEAERILADIARHAELLSVTVKAGEATHAAASGPTLEAARAFLAAGTLHGMQLRYRFDGEAWTDTFLRQGTGAFRLVRMRADAPPLSPR
jgi:hypothetical protein